MEHNRHGGLIKLGNAIPGQISVTLPVQFYGVPSKVFVDGGLCIPRYDYTVDTLSNQLHFTYPLHGGESITMRYGDESHKTMLLPTAVVLDEIEKTHGSSF